MAAKFAATFLLLVVLSLGFALATSDVKTKDGDIAEQHLRGLVRNSFKQCARSVQQILGNIRGLLGLSYDLWSEYSEVTRAFDICTRKKTENPEQKSEEVKEACQEDAIFKFWINTTKSTPDNRKATERSIFGCVPNLMLVYDALNEMFKLYINYQEVRKAFDDKREKCSKISNSNEREMCLKSLEEEEKPAYQKITDRFRSLITDLVTEGQGLLKCLTGLELHV